MANRKNGLDEKENGACTAFDGRLQKRRRHSGKAQAVFRRNLGSIWFKYPEEIRKIIYTTNAVERYHRMVRKFTKSKAVFPTDDSIGKVIYMSVVEISKKWTMPVRDWGLAYSQFAIFLRTGSQPDGCRGLSAWGISGEDEEKQQHFCYCSSPFYSAACVGSLLSVALFGCNFSMVKIVVGNSFTQFIFQTRFPQKAKSRQQSCRSKFDSRLHQQSAQLYEEIALQSDFFFIAA